MKILDGCLEKTNKVFSRYPKRLKYEKPNWQICFKKQHAIDQYLTFIGSEKI